MFNTDLKQGVESTKCIGVGIDKNLTWDGHLRSIRHEVTSNLRLLKKVKHFLKSKNNVVFHRSINARYFSYRCAVWDHGLLVGFNM